MSFFDSVFKGAPSDDEAFRLGAMRIRELKDKLDTLLGKIFASEDGTFNSSGLIPGSAISGIDVSSLSSTAQTALLLPTGTILPFAGTVAPTNFLFCDGSFKLRSAYPDLFAIIGTTYGTGDGTNFALPDLRGRTPVGLDNMGGGTRAGRVSGVLQPGGLGDVATVLGGAGGEAKHTLDITEVPPHQHTFHDWPVSETRGGGGSTASPIIPGITSALTGSAGGSAGVAVPHNVIQPSLFLNYLIRI